MVKFYEHLKTIISRDQKLLAKNIPIESLQQIEWMVFNYNTKTVSGLATLALDKYENLSEINKNIFMEFLKTKDQNGDDKIDLDEFISFNNDWSSEYFKNVEVDEKPTFDNKKLNVNVLIGITTKTTTTITYDDDDDNDDNDERRRRQRVN
ncbi:uncharacterized protein LOC126893543 [Daktulosphaira vitifoliae]|uniref:uncharacterized protein LOC126893543 n=1 Tax=Daktulosphaira vitifoliae TaxID=58002 RepID=UPI0021AAC993|nr:uncharacterized protein LOC126893543 [Daktulosphaira vitifoliae]